MGFFSGVSSIAGGLSGLAGGAKQSQGVPASGYYSMPPEYQKLYGQQAGNISSTLFPNGNINSAMFTPLAQTGEETKALGMVNQGIAPTADTLQADLAMLMNPFDESVIDGINREATGQNSLVNQYATQAGQQGSNRSFLGTSDVEQNRLNNIGQFRQSQYNTAINQALGPLAALRQQDISNLFGAGEFQRTLDEQTKQAPYTALSAAGGLLGALPTQFGTQSQAGTAKSGSSAGSAFDKISQGAQLAGTIAGLFSDMRLKHGIEYYDEKEGHKRYKFRYNANPDKEFIGVMAQEVIEKDPLAVEMSEDGYYMVDYGRLGFEMEEV